MESGLEVVETPPKATKQLLVFADKPYFLTSFDILVKSQYHSSHPDTSFEA